MPAKQVRTHGGRWITVKSVRLPNGHLVIPQRMAHDRTVTEWVEVMPGSSEHKRWLPVAEDEPDPRLSPDYLAHMKAVVASDSYKKWMRTQR